MNTLETTMTSGLHFATSALTGPCKILRECVIPKHRVFGYTAWISPEVAAALLATSKGNRHLKMNNISKWSDEMRNDQWALTGESIIMSDTGHLLDGHNRLEAVVVSGTAIITTVIEGVEESAFSRMNTGTTRTPGDIFSIAGVPNSNVAAAAIRASEEYRHCRGKTSIHMLRGAESLSKAQMLQMYFADEEAWSTAVRLGGAVYKATGASNSQTSAMVYLFMQVDRDKAERFAMDIAMGENLRHGHPALGIRNMILKDRGAKRQEGRRSYMVKLVHAWNAYRKGSNLLYPRHNLADTIPSWS